MASKSKDKLRNPQPKVDKAMAKELSLLVDSPQFWKTRWFMFPLCIGLAFVLYFQCIPYGYVLDDVIVIVDNSYTQRGLGGIGKILTTESFAGYFNEQRDLVEGGRYRPLSIITFAIENSISPNNPKLSHIINILLYGLCGFLIFRILSFFYKDEEKWWLSIPLSITILYLLHPIHTEAVANIKGRDEIMALIFGMAALYYALKYVLTPNMLTLAAMAAMYYLGLLSKENVLTFAGVIPVCLYLFHRKDRASQLKVFGTLVLLTLLYLTQRYMIIGYLISSTPITDVMNNPFLEMNFAQKYATIFFTLGKYLWLCLFPHPLTHDYYPYQIPIMDWGKAWVYVSLLGYIGISIWALARAKKDPHSTFAWLFYLLTLFIVSNLLFNVGTFMNERFVFLSSLGIVWLLVHLLFGHLRKYTTLPSWLGVAALSVIGLGYTVKTWTRVPVWENATTLNRAAVTISTNSARANSFMATALFNDYKETQDKDEQLRLLQEADYYINRSLDIMPDYGNANLMAAGVAAELYKQDYNLDKLLSSFKTIALRRPEVSYITEYLDYLKDRGDQSTLLKFYAELGEGLRQKRNYQWALHYLSKGMEVNPNDPQVRRVVAATYRSAGDESKAQLYD